MLTLSKKQKQIQKKIEETVKTIKKLEKNLNHWKFELKYVKSKKMKIGEDFCLWMITLETEVINYYKSELKNLVEIAKKSNVISAKR